MSTWFSGKSIIKSDNTLLKIMGGKVIYNWVDNELPPTYSSFPTSPHRWLLSDRIWSKFARILQICQDFARIPELKAIHSPLFALGSCNFLSVSFTGTLPVPNKWLALGLQIQSSEVWSLFVPFRWVQNAANLWPLLFYLATCHHSLPVHILKVWKMKTLFFSCMLYFCLHISLAISSPGFA